MNIPNLLTVFRLSLIPVYIFIYLSGHSYRIFWSMIVLFTAGITDIADGYWARKTKQVTELGKILDPLADKLMVTAILSCFVPEKRVTLWEAGVVVFRDVVMILCAGVFRWRGMKTVPANWWGKGGTLLLYFVLFGFLLNWPYMHNLLWVVALVLYIAAWIYIREVYRVNALDRHRFR
ncbi:CDP-diacylglycerol--glycerol-3-phosphate 3-phosphatidyltransferase [Pasteuria penetrans]|uniref:CDP-diacylglycerol--glycerol-3-phosphate 3-phosphatidyltransferase n=1 Tax=Pasteuria penetrans TaxID=86005 RepID=UPI000F97C423|nr:CDP-diacylglycerol--glycerol-3-phosphate 3-phosphatidyltransferase [Pasteuria penetrans]